MLRTRARMALMPFILFGVLVILIGVGKAVAHTSATVNSSLMSNVAIGAGASIAVTTNVDELNSDGDCSLREAVQAADADTAIDQCLSSEGADTIYLPAGLYLLSMGPITLTSVITLEGSITAATILDANGLSRVLAIQPEAKVTLLHLDIRNGEVPAASSGNDAGYVGEGGGVLNKGITTIAYSTIHDNHAGAWRAQEFWLYGAHGGGIFNGGILTVTNSTISGNRAGDGGEGASQGEEVNCGPAGEGGGIANFGTLILAFTTVTNNEPGRRVCVQFPDVTSGVVGGLYNPDTDTVFVRNSLIAGNHHSDCIGRITAQGNNLFQSVENCTIDGNYIQRRADLNPLLDNGGATLTHALAERSPTINAADCFDSAGITVTVDQRGEPRPQGESCDIGAYESPYTGTFAIHNTNLPLVAFTNTPCIKITPACNLTNSPLNDQAPTWSPDGQKIAFARSKATGSELGIYVLNADGSDLVQLKEYGSHPVWSPDGSKIAFETRRDGNRGIYVMDADDGQEMRLTNPIGYDDYVVAWSPDGSKILYEHVDLSGNSFPYSNPHIKVMNRDGSNEIELPIAGAQLSPSPWSPDSNKIVINTTHAESILIVVDLDGTYLISFPSDDENVNGTWSPDGNKIAFGCEIGFERGDICVINIDGTNRVNLTADGTPDSGAPLWSPDGGKLLFLRRFDAKGAYQLAVIKGDGTHLVQLTNIQKDAYLGGAVWSPDSRKVAYFSGMMENAPDIYIVGVGE